MPLLCILYTFFSGFLFDFLCVFSCFCVYRLMKWGSRPAGRGDCGGDDNCIVETKAGRLSLKGELNPSGQKKSKGCKWLSKVYTFIENIFRTQSSLFGLWQIGNVILVKQDYQIGIIEKMQRYFLCDMYNKKMHILACTSLFRCMI